MIDLKLLRSNIEFVFHNYLRRNFYLNIDLFKSLDFKVRTVKFNLDLLRNKHKNKSENFKVALKKKFPVDTILEDVELLKKRISEEENELVIFENDFNDFLLSLPNLIHDSVPYAYNFSDIFEIRTFSRKVELDINTNFYINDKYIDFKSSANVSGSGFVYLLDDIAVLHRAICNFMLDFHLNNHGYKEVYSPVLVNEKSMYMTGHFPKFCNDQFKIDNSNLWLIPTAEVTLSNLVCNKIIDEASFPLKYVSHTPCFRKEVGSYGSNVKGMIRQHQFEKVELVQVVKAKDSYYVLDELISHVENILKALDLSYRVISLNDKDIGFTSSKTYDIEAWFPSKKKYIELSSCS
ncbi:MAG: serine--tRNA ligase, partial [Pelagibacterales bacterium]|nr:serine--tRNA ligase [Pelagibacterales bacterium]